MGKHDPTQLRELLSTKLVRVYLHDCEEYVSKDSNVTFAVGQASFSFRDFLRPYCKFISLRSDVFPMKKEITDNTNELDLNTTARRNDKVIDKFSPYMANMTYFNLKADLAFPIGLFDEKKAMQEMNTDASKHSLQTMTTK